MLKTSDIIIWILTCIFLTIICARHFIQTHNNSCKTAKDYYSYLDNNAECFYNPDLDLTVPAIIRRYGYEVETYEVATEDHYILTAYRILPKKSNGSTISQPQPVYLQHGLFQNSMAFLMNGKKSLPFVLVEAGYDVWLGNFRGTYYSRHTYLTRREGKFWDYSLDEYAIYDISALVDLVYVQTQRKIIYIGYSFGATIGYVYSSRFYEVADRKIHLLVSLGPTVHPKEWKSGSKHILTNWNYIVPMVNFMTRGNVDIKKLGYFDWSSVCFPFPFQMKLCDIALRLTYDFTIEKISPEYWPLMLWKNFDVVSVKVLTHLSQIVLNEEYHNYDNGQIANQRVPVDLNLVKIPTYILRAAGDSISTKINVDFLLSHLPQEAKQDPVYVVKDSNFTHGDLLWHEDADVLVNRPLITFLDEFTLTKIR